MKGRWRSVFTKALEVSVRKAPMVIAACAAMHNVCMRAQDFCQDLLEEHDDTREELQPALKPGKQDASELRGEIAARMSCPRGHHGEHDYRAVL